MCCSPWSHKELDTTKRLNNNNKVMAQPLVSWEMTRSILAHPAWESCSKGRPADTSSTIVQMAS